MEESSHAQTRRRAEGSEAALETAKQKLRANMKEKENLSARLQADKEKENKEKEEMRNMTQNLDEAKAKVFLLPGICFSAFFLFKLLISLACWFA